MAHFCPPSRGAGRDHRDMSIDVSDFLRYSLQIYAGRKEALSDYAF